MPSAASQSKSARLNMLASIAIIVAGLYFAREVLIPLALAIMLSFLLAPLLLRLQRWGLPRVLALIVVITLLVGSISGLGFVVYGQITDLAGKLDEYKQNIQEKVTWFKRFTQNAAVDKITKALSEATTRPTTIPATQPAVVTDIFGFPMHDPTRAARPTPVTVVDEKPADAAGANAFKNLYQSVSHLVDPLATAGIVLIFAIFMLVSREDLRDRVIRLIGQGRINVTTQAMDEAAQRVSKYLVAQCIVNGTYGLAVGLGLWLIGITAGHNEPSFPNWFLWGALTGILRFIPYIGPWIGAAFPILLSLAVYHGMTVPLCVIGMFILLELLSNNLMEPLLYGTSTGVSTVAILVAAVFWTWIWGFPGLLLATPLTVLIAVTGKYVPQLEFLNIMLGDEPALEPRYRLYQRLLAEDTEEVEDLVDEYLQKKSVPEIYDEVVLPALSLAEHDWKRDRLDQAKQTAVRQAVRDLVEEIGDKPINTVQIKAAGTPEPSGGIYERNILCLPARDPADEIASMMLAQVLDQQGYHSEFVSVDRLASEYLDIVEKKQIQIVVISALPPAAVTHARYLVKRLHSRFPDVKIIVGLWTAQGSLEKPRKRLESVGTTLVVGSLAAAVEQVRQTVQPLILTEKNKVSEQPALAVAQ